MDGGTSEPVVTPRDDAVKKRQRRANKVRSAWISFVGRIVAQFVGSAATIVLGLILLQKHSASEAMWHQGHCCANDRSARAARQDGTDSNPPLWPFCHCVASSPIAHRLLWPTG
jgi:hypothetical protein